MERNRKGVTPLFLCILSLLAISVYALPAQTQVGTGPVQVLTNSVDSDPLEADTSPRLTDMVPQFVPPSVFPVQRPKLQQLMNAPHQGASAPLPGLLGPRIPAIIPVNFDGVGSPNSCNCAPPDPNLAVGDTQVVQWVNTSYAVYDKTTGALVAGPFPGNHFFTGMKSACASSNAGDPIIQWDKANHVWVATQNVFGPYLTCIAVSTTSDATGTYNRYAFNQPGFPDYVKWGLTPNIYYQTQNDFGPAANAFVGVNVCAYDGAAMRAGSKKAKQICILDNSNGTLFDDSMLPADADAGSSSTPEVLLGSIDNPGFNSAVYEYVFTVSFGHGPHSTATLAGVNGSMPIPVPAFNLACGGFGACIQQPGVTDLLDSLGDRLMYRLARFDDGTTQHFLVTHSVNNTTATAARWYEFRAPSGSTALSLFQSGETLDDGHYRWMGSVARDKDGNIALGYSRSSSLPLDYPSVYVAGQTAGEPPGTTDLESLIFPGTGSQIDTGSRWGDYTSMALDGADRCSFWYTNEYYKTNGSFAWSTRVAEIKFPTCP